MISKGDRTKNERWRYEIYQNIMGFLIEYLPEKGYHVSKTVTEESEYGDDETFEEYLQGDLRENLVRDYLQLPTVQEDRKKADDLVRELQRKANQK